MKKLVICWMVCILLAIPALGISLDNTTEVTGKALDNGQYEITVTQGGDTRQAILDDVTGWNPMQLEGGSFDTTRIRIYRDVTLSGVDYSYENKFDQQVTQLDGLFDLETMTMLAKPIYFLGDYMGPYTQFDYVPAAVGTTKFSYYKGQTTPLDGKFGILDKDFQVVVPCTYDKITWVADNIFDCDGRYLSPGTQNHFDWIEGFDSYLATFDRYFLEFDGSAFLVDGNLNTIFSGYAPYEELEFGKYRFNVDEKHSVVIDNQGNIITDFDSAAEGKISDWAKGYVQTAVESELISSIEKPNWRLDTAFYTEEITRAGFCDLVRNFLVTRKLENPEGAKIPFTDIDDVDFGIQDCYRLGIVQGKSATEFDPYANITRQEAATMLLRLCKVLGINTTTNDGNPKFLDCKNLESWAKDGVMAISALKNSEGEAVMGGTSATTFEPLETYTLEQAITTLVRLDNMPSMEPTLPYEVVCDYNENGVALARDQLADGSYVAFYVDKDGKVLSDLYDNGQDFQNGFAGVEKNKKYGFIDENFQVVAECIYDDGVQYYAMDNGILQGGFQGGFARVSREHLWGFIDETGTEIVPCQYGSATLFQDGLSLVTDVEPGRLQSLPVHYGFVNQGGEEVIPVEYDFAHPFEGDLALVKKDGLWGAIDRQNNMVVPLQYEQDYQVVLP